jgi:hypothetical protein
MKKKIFGQSASKSSRLSKVNAMMTAVMFMALLLTACNDLESKETLIEVESAARELMAQEDLTMIIGHTEYQLDATAVTAEGDTINGKVNVDYTGAPKVYVEQLGLPIYLDKDDGDTFRFNDGQVISRELSVEGNLDDAGSNASWLQTVIVDKSNPGAVKYELLAQINDSTELCCATFNENWWMRSTQLPKDFKGAASGEKEVLFLYLRVVKPAAADPEPEPDEVTYEKRWEFKEDVDGETTLRLFVNRLRNGVSEQEWKLSSFPVLQHGLNNPLQGMTMRVKTLKYSVNENPERNIDFNPAPYQAGTKKTFTVETVSDKAYNFVAKWLAPTDAFGESYVDFSVDIRTTVRKATFVDPETGHEEVFDFDVKVWEDLTLVDGVFTRTVNISVDGTVVYSASGSLTLILVE